MKSFKTKTSNNLTSTTNTVYSNALQMLINVPSTTTTILLINSLGMASVDCKLQGTSLHICDLDVGIGSMVQQQIKDVYQAILGSYQQWSGVVLCSHVHHVSVNCNQRYRFILQLCFLMCGLVT